MNSARSVLLLCGLLYALPGFADGSLSYEVLKIKVQAAINGYSHVPNPSLAQSPGGWSDTCDGAVATCDKPATVFSKFQSDVPADPASSVITNKETSTNEVGVDPYDKEKFGQDPNLGKPLPDAQNKEYQWWYEKNP